MPTIDQTPRMFCNHLFPQLSPLCTIILGVQISIGLPLISPSTPIRTYISDRKEIVHLKELCYLKSGIYACDFLSGQNSVDSYLHHFPSQSTIKINKQRRTLKGRSGQGPHDCRKHTIAECLTSCYSTDERKLGLEFPDTLLNNRNGSSRLILPPITQIPGIITGQPNITGKGD